MIEIFVEILDLATLGASVVLALLLILKGPTRGESLVIPLRRAFSAALRVMGAWLH